MIQKKQSKTVAKRVPIQASVVRARTHQNHIAIPTQGKIDLIDLDQIAFLKSDSNYTEIHLIDGSTIVTSTTLKKYESKLKSSKFMRVHNSYIIQRAQLKSFLPQQNKLILRNTQMLPVSRSKKEGLMKYLKMLMVSVALLLCGQGAVAQGFTNFQINPNGSSDYFLTINWSANTAASCGDCYWANDNFNFYINTLSGPFLLNNTNLSHAATQEGSFTTAVGPARSDLGYGELFVYPAELDFLGVCTPIQACPTATANSGDYFFFSDSPYAPTINTPTYDVEGNITFHWDNNTDIPVSNYTTRLYKNSTNQADLIGVVNGGETSFESPTCFEAGDVLYALVNFSGNVAGVSYGQYGLSSSITLPTPLPPVLMRPGSIKGKITTISGSNVPDVLVTAELQGSLPGAPCAPTTYTAMTQENGTYTIPFIYWGEPGDITTFKVTPSFPMHSFDPMDQNVILQIGSDDIEDVDFVDTTSVDVLGKVVVNGINDDCGLDNVLITATGPGSSASFAQTTGDGTFALLLPETGLFNIVFEFNGMSFHTVDTMVDDNMLLPDIMYNQLDTIRGFSGAGCLEDIGQMTVEARTPTGCPIANAVTNPSGYYELIVPTIPMDVQIVGYDPQDSGLEYNDVYPAIDSIYEIDFDSTMTLNIQYRKPITIDVIGMPPPPCPSVAYPVLNQDQQYTITINIWESVDICFADTGTVTITDDISTFGNDDPLVTEVPFANGQLQYTISAGDPALSTPFLKFINITAMVDNEVATLSVPVIVSGTRIRTSTIVSAPSDSIPLLILRDPPGDQSKAWHSVGNVTRGVQSFSHEVGGSVKAWVKAKPSVFGAVFLNIEGSLQYGGSRISSTETAVTLETKNYYETSPSGAFVGEDGDLILGAAINFEYGLSDDRFFDLNTCSMTVDTSLIFSPESFESSYRFSVKFIKEDIIPRLEFLSQNQDTTEAFRRKFANKLLVWEQILQLNRDQKEKALLRPIDIFSFDAGSSQTSTFTGVTADRTAIEFTTTLDADISLSAGVKSINFEGSAGVDVKIRSEWGASDVRDTIETTTTGYTFADNDPGDNHFFKFAIDSVYGTPVFEVIGGASSCPHEDNTQFIDLVKLTFDEPTMVGQQGEEFLDFDFTIQNLGETNATREYIFDLVDDNNPGATVTFNGAAISDPGITFTLNAGQAKTGTVRVTRPAGDQYVFEGIEFEAFAGCFASGSPNPDKTFNSTALISAYFFNDCSNVNLTAPGNNWLVNSQSPDFISVTMDQYDLGTATNIKLQYLNQKDGQWMDSNIDISGANLLPPPQTYQWDVSGLSDGNYVIRWELECASIVNWSPRKTGKVDRTPPRVFGVEKPTTDLYFPGDEISVQFNEEIDYSNLTNGHIYLKAIPEGNCIPVQLQGSLNEVILVLQESIDSMYNQTFEAGVFGIVDLFGNAKPDTAKWEFMVNEPDGDGDGIPDTKDRCPGGDDMKDTDMDGLPDDCDCLPTIPINSRELTKAAMHFDGVNDYIRVPNHPDLIPTATNALTMETWIYPDSNTTNELGHISASGSFPNRNHQIYLINNTNKIIVDGLTANAMISNADVPHNEWTHIAVAFNLNETKLYINGQLDKTRISSLTANNLGFDLTIGSQDSGAPSSWNWKGAMDEMRYWNNARSEQEIQALMNKELVGDEAGLVAHFPFNEGTPYGMNEDIVSFIFDQSPNQFLGALNGFAKVGNESNWVNSPMYLLGLEYDICTTCKDTLNAAMDFDGNDDYINIANDPSLIPTPDNAITFEAWINPKKLEGTIMIASAGFFLNSNFDILLLDGQVRVNSYNAGVLTSPSPIPICKWTHIAVVFSAVESQLYINGMLKAVGPVGLTNNLGHSIAIGSQSQNQGIIPSFKGQLDDIRFWDSARTAAEIQENLYTELAGDETGLAAYYDFNNGMPMAENDTITVVPDVSGNGHHGDPLNFYQFGMFSNWVKSPLRFAGDLDEDGRPDVCDDCLPESVLMLDNQALNGTYRALDEIILGSGINFENFANVILRAPKVTVLQSISKPANVYIEVRKKPCDK